MSAELLVEPIPNPTALGALETEWDELHARVRPRLPFATPYWLSRWWHHYSEQRPFVHDEFFVHTLRNRSGKLVAVAPLMLTERPGFGPFRARRLAFFGSDRNVTELRGLLCAPEDEPDAVSSLSSYLFERKREWDWFVWTGLRGGGKAAAMLSENAGFSWSQESPDFVLELPSTWAELRSTRSRNIKESLRKCYNSLKREGHEFRFRVASTAATVPVALRHFLKLHAARAKAENMFAHANVFGTERARAFLADLAREPERAPHLRVFELEISGRVVASRLGFLLGDELYLYFSGFDPEWGRYSVMTTVVAEAIKWAIEQRCRFVNLSPGADQSKSRWGAAALPYSAGVLVSPTERAKLTFAALQRLDDHSRTDTPLGKLLALARRTL